MVQPPLSGSKMREYQQVANIAASGHPAAWPCLSESFGAEVHVFLMR
jgi:hypothetical protein